MFDQFARIASRPPAGCPSPHWASVHNLSGSANVHSVMIYEGRRSMAEEIEGDDAASFAGASASESGDGAARAPARATPLPARFLSSRGTPTHPGVGVLRPSESGAADDDEMPQGWNDGMATARGLPAVPHVRARLGGPTARRPGIYARSVPFSSVHLWGWNRKSPTPWA